MAWVLQGMLGAQGPGLRGTMKRPRHWSKGRLGSEGHGQEGVLEVWPGRGRAWACDQKEARLGT